MRSHKYECPKHVNTPELRAEWDNSPEIRAAYDEGWKEGERNAKKELYEQGVAEKGSRSSRSHKEPRSSHRKHRDRDDGGGRPAQRYDSQQSAESHRDPYASGPAPRSSHSHERRAHDDRRGGVGRPVQRYDSQQLTRNHRDPHVNDPYAGRLSKSATSSATIHGSGRGGRLSINRRVIQDQLGYVNQHPVPFGVISLENIQRLQKYYKSEMLTTTGITS
jgi:hypothetical protein